MKLNIKNPLSLFFSKLIYNKRFTLLFSIISAFIFWLIIMISQNPVRQQTFNDIAVAVQIENTYAQKQGLSIVSDISSQKFSVVLSGPSYIVSSLKPEDFLLSASVEEVNSAGTHSLKIVPTHNSSKRGYTFVSVTPPTIDVTFDYIDTKKYDVTPRVEGVTADEGLIAENPVITSTENKTLTLTGPRSILERIAKVEAYVESSEKLKKSKTYDAALVFYNANGKVMYKYDTDGKIYNGNDVPIESTSTYLSPSFTNVKVTVPVVKKKVLTFNAMFSDRPEGVSDSMFVYKTIPGSITVIGAPEYIDSLERIDLAPISYNALSSRHNTFKVQIIVPDGLRIVDNVSEVTVKVDYAATMRNIKASQ